MTKQNITLSLPDKFIGYLNIYVINNSTYQSSVLGMMCKTNFYIGSPRFIFSLSDGFVIMSLGLEKALIKFLLNSQQYDKRDYQANNQDAGGNTYNRSSISKQSNNSTQN